MPPALPNQPLDYRRLRLSLTSCERRDRFQSRFGRVALAGVILGLLGFHYVGPALWHLL